MRPVVLDLAGFGSFRDPTTVDFRDADYFALVGPTGSGKSTVIDAMTFALYGTVPRWDDRRAVGLALAPTVNRGTVRLVFDVGGGRYVAARELRRAASGGVNVKAARLERLKDPSGLGEPGEDTEVLAADSGVSPAVESLLGLPYEHFVTCVVLPQGDFAEFLHKRAGQRQDILVKLLGLEMYGTIAQLANQEAAAEKQRADYAERQLAGYADATPESERAARREAAALSRLSESVRSALPALADAGAKVDKLRDARARLQEERTRLSALRAPTDLEQLDIERRNTADRVAEASKTLTAAEKADASARAKKEKAPARTPIEKALDDRGRLVELEEALPDLKRQEHACHAELAIRKKAVQQARQAVKNAVAHTEAAQRSDLAAALRPHLRKGSPCPVCEQLVSVLPTTTDANELASVEAALAKAQAELEAQQKKYETASRAEVKATAAVESLTLQLEQLRLSLQDAASLTALEKQIAQLNAIDEACQAADERVRQARKNKQTAEAAVSKLSTRLTKARVALDQARDPLVALGAPQMAHEDLAAGWSTLLAWATKQIAIRDRKLAATHEELKQAERIEQASLEKLRADLAAQGIFPEGSQPLVEVAEAMVVASAERAKARAERIKERRGEAATLQATRKAALETHQVARQLGLLLKADAFPRWLVTTALDSLVDGASATLAELSGGQFELDHEGGDFVVIDHADADSRRPVKTLSGGETFQASLSLALALSAQLAAMAAAGAATLDSIFLDEGFGTLDEATLEIVAATLENLATRGDRMVGIVTHVPALAERVPVRFAVRRDQRTSSLARETL
jgi:exonuclease SbcC